MSGIAQDGLRCLIKTIAVLDYENMTWSFNLPETQRSIYDNIRRP